MLRALLVLALASCTFSASTSGGSGQNPGPGPAPGSGGGTPPPAAARAPTVPKDHALYGRFEGSGADNACSSDAQCFKAGCGGEICSATKDMVSTCEVLPVSLPATASCGCVTGECLWWSSDGAQLAAAPAPETPATPPPGAKCGEKTCAGSEECIEYYGVAGPRGPRFQTCGIRCKKGQCPDGKKCVTIADGPGPVCQ